MASRQRLATPTKSSDVVVRPYVPADREQFLSLYETVWGRRKGREWFDWRFSANPYGDDIRMVIAEVDGEMVGAEPLLPFRLRVGSRTLDADQPVDWIVHPDHQRKGIFSRMTTFLLEQYDDTDLLFNFPSDALRPGLEKFDWTVAGEVSMSHRVQRPSKLLSWTGADGALADVLSAPLDIAANGGLALLDRITTPPGDVTVERHSELPVETLAELYASAVPERVHIPRDEAFLEWRFGNPCWETTTYVAVRDGTPVGSIVTATEQLGSCTRTNLLDIQPMDDFGPGASSDAFEALVSEVIADHRSVDVLRAPTTASPELLRRYGFLSDAAFPLSRVTAPSTHVVRPLGGPQQGDPTTDREFDIDGVGLLDAENWLLLPADLDIE
ncbi:GNAT family N-acetyltransferase [Natronomonas gomsonensis]|uniref:GNAT family N-acetyltransferase n=1 Tax=Natronomonas gomsonensis TaxID=1046043 RepID=UPI0015BA4E6E|nr:GNAT family N-acetyltransferase [Natronomonas gomsonensis]